MGTIDSKWLDDFYDQNPQLEKPFKAALGYLVGDKIQPAIETLLNIVTQHSTEKE